MKKIDMHIHTCYSDGEYTPDEIIKMAQEKNISTIAITDHDTLLGIKNKTLQEQDTGIQVIDGIELSVKDPIGRFHLLGYDFDVNNEELNRRAESMHNRSLYSVVAVLCQLRKDYDISFSTEEILEILNLQRNIGRPDIAKLLIKHGIVDTVDDAFTEYLIDAHNKTKGVAASPTPEEAIKLIKQANGFAVLAHPVSLERTKEELDRYVGELVECGLDGIEVYHSNHSPKQVEEYLALASKYNLLISGGSDYHGPSVKPDVELGEGKKNIKIKQLSLLDKINERR